MKKKNNTIKTFKLMVTLFMIGILVYAIAYLFPIMKYLTTQEGRAMFQQKIASTGAAGACMLFGLEFAQIFLVILPGEPLEILAGMCYGAIGGTIFLTVSVLAITAMIVYLVRIYGKKLVYEFFAKEKVDKIEKSKLFNNPKQIEMMMFILFFIPGTPKDLLVYVGGLLPIKPTKFILISTFARFPSIISSTLAGSHIIQGNWKNIVLIYAITFGLVAGMFLLIHLLDKNKQTEKILKEIQ